MRFTRSSDEAIGVSVKAVNSDAIMVTEVRIASCLNITPTIPPIKIIGIKTMSVVSVDAVIACPISLVPTTAASIGFNPFSICCVIFSRTTIALSTTIPMAIISDIRLKILIVQPSANISIKAVISENGMVRNTMRLSLHSLRNAKTITTTKNSAYQSDCVRFLILSTISSSEFITSLMLTSAGSVFSISFSFVLTARVTASVFSPV